MNQESLLRSTPLSQGVFVFLEKDGVETIGFGHMIGFEDVQHAQIPKIALISENIFEEKEEPKNFHQTIFGREPKKIIICMGLVLPNTNEIHHLLSIRIGSVESIRKMFSTIFQVNSDIRYFMYRK